jgi:ribonuclease BN (tRNA processing enzyme)
LALSLQFVGCGDAFGSGGRFNTCFHLTGERTNLLIDCGASSLIAMKRLGIDRNAIRTIAVTHFHADHFGGIPFFLLDAQFFSKRREPLTIVGPPGLPQWYERVMETAFPGSSGAARKFALELLELPAGSFVEVDGARIGGFAASHGPAEVPCLSIRIEAEGKAIAYTGDTEWSEALIDAAREADLFIAEAYFRDKMVATHLSLAEIEANLARLTARRLVLTHMSEDMLNHPDRVLYETAEDGMVIVVE